MKLRQRGCGLRLSIETTVVSIVWTCVLLVASPAKVKQLVVAAEETQARRRIYGHNRMNIDIREWLQIQYTG